MFVKLIILFLLRKKQNSFTRAVRFKGDIYVLSIHNHTAETEELKRIEKALISGATD